MDDRTLAALRGSIAKWQSIVDGVDADKGTSNCPLCKMFHTDYGGTFCHGCPVRDKTGLAYCDNTPFREWVYGVRGPDRRVLNEESRQLARTELDFLVSLLPQENAP